MMFPCLGIFLVLIAFIAASTFRAKQQQKELFEQFLQKENEANQTRRQDLNTLSYIHIPLDRFPFGRYEPEIFSSYEDSLRTLAETKMVNLNSKSNTELKLKYGVANLDALLTCEKNFDQLCETLNEYGQTLAEQGHTEDARQVLEYAVSIKTDYTNSFLTLARLYQAQGNRTKLEALIPSTAHIDSFRRKKLTDQLHELLALCP